MDSWLGFRWDRNWLIVNSKGRGLTQRVEPKLSLIDVEMPEHAFAEGWEPDKSSNMGKIVFFLLSTSEFSFMKIPFFSSLFTVVRAPGMDVLKVSLAKPEKIADGVSVWEWFGSALDEGEEASNWFTTFVGKPCRLVRFDSGLYILISALHPFKMVVAMQVY